MSVASHRLGTGVQKWVKVSDTRMRKLGVKGVYTQRDLRPFWVKAQIPTFNQNGIGTLILVWDEKDQCYYVIDGQHRRELLLAMGFQDKLCPALVYYDLSIPEEADLFLIYNNKGNVGNYQKFRVRVTADEPTAVGVMQVLASLGLQLSPQQGQNCVRATAALERIYTGAERGPAAALLGPTVLKRALFILKEAYGSGNSSTGYGSRFDGTLIEGLGCVLLEHGAFINDEHLITALTRKGSSDSLLGTARSLRGALGGSHANSAAATIVTYYNHGLTKKGRLPSWVGQQVAPPANTVYVSPTVAVKTLTKSMRKVAASKQQSLPGFAIKGKP